MKLVLYIALILAPIAFGQGGGADTAAIKLPAGEAALQDVAIQIRFVDPSGIPFPYTEYGEGLRLHEYSIRSHSTLKPLVTMNGEYSNFKRSGYFRGLSDLNGAYGSPAGTSTQNGIGYRTGAGVKWQGLYKKWHISIAGVQGTYMGDSSYHPKSYFNWTSGNTHLYADLRSRISFTPNKFFNFQAGIDHNFIGEGSRSLFLSDYGNPYPFGLIRSRFWRLEYAVLYQFLREGTSGNRSPKFTSSHHISFNPAKWLNIGVFETVIFNPRDTLLNRGFDVEYLNPMVFYRPQEYSVGSSDNVLLGIDVTGYYKHFTFYSQFILDEFYLEEIRAKSGWWANKFGGQFGAKAVFKNDSTCTFVRTELNFVRPYTYAHLNDALNYGNMGLPLAHPYGANFAEILSEVQWTNFRRYLNLRLFVSYTLRGGDRDGYNYGASIYEPYINRPYEKGHFIGQGTQTNRWLIRLVAERQIPKLQYASVFIENNLGYTVQYNAFDYLLVVGLRTKLWNDYRNY